LRNSVYPHGGYPTLAIWLTCAAAFIATTFGAASCRFLTLTYTSDQGDIEESFADFSAREGQDQVEYKAGIGLFQYLRPNNKISGEWSDGYCVGYTDTIREALGDSAFEAARGFAIFSVLLGFCLTMWCFLMACLSINQYQIWIMTGCLVMGSLSAGFTFLISTSSVCNDVFIARECSLDEGGLIMVAAVLLWLTAFSINVLFVKVSPFENDYEHDDHLALAQNSIDASAKNTRSRQVAVRSTNSSKVQTQRLSNNLRGKKEIPNQTTLVQVQHQQPIIRSQAPPQQLTVDDVTNQRALEVFVSRQDWTVDDVSNQQKMEVFDSKVWDHSKHSNHSKAEV
jgi:hypothetical protein